MKKSYPYLVNVGSPSVQGTLFRPLFHIRLEISICMGWSLELRLEHCVLGRLTVKSTVRFFRYRWNGGEGLSDDPDRLVPGIPLSK